MAFKIKTKDDKDFTLLSPKEKGQKYGKELREKKRYTNDGALKNDGKELTREEAAYRSGYLDARADIGKAYAAVSKKTRKSNRF